MGIDFGGHRGPLALSYWWLGAGPSSNPKRDPELFAVRKVLNHRVPPRDTMPSMIGMAAVLAVLWVAAYFIL